MSVNLAVKSSVCSIMASFVIDILKHCLGRLVVKVPRVIETLVQSLLETIKCMCPCVCMCQHYSAKRTGYWYTVTFNLTVETQDGSAGISCNRSQNTIYFTLSGEMLYVMYNLPHCYMHISNSTSVHGIFCSQWPRGGFSVLVTNRN